MHKPPNQYPNIPQPVPAHETVDPENHRTKIKNLSTLTLVGIGAGVMALGGVIGATIAVAGTSTPSEACQTAVTQASDAIDLYSEATNAAADGIGAVASNRPYQIRQATNTINSISEELTPILVDFYAAHDQCLDK